MRVLFLYPYAPGSVASFVRPANIIKHLLASGLQVTLATVCHLRLAATGINLSMNEFPHLKSIPIIRLSAERGAVYRNLVIVNRLLKSHDLIHFQKCHPVVSLPAVCASLMQQKPVHYDWDDNETGILTRLVSEGSASRQQLCSFRLVERRLVRLVDTVSVASSQLRSLALSYGASKDAVFDAPVGADLDLFSPKSAEPSRRGPIVLYQGQLEEASFAEDFIRCAVRVRAEVPDASFKIVGGGVKLSRLRELAEANGVQMDFTGYISHREVAGHISSADVCVATFEDNEVTRCKSPLKIAEYLACGKPIVATEVGDVGRMVGEAGLLVSEGDVDGLADAVVLLLRDSAFAAKLGAMARMRAEREFNWGRTTRAIMDGYEMALRRFGMQGLLHS